MVNNFGGIRMKTLMYIDSLSQNKINNEEDPENKELISQLRNYDYGLMTQHLQYNALKKIRPVLTNNEKTISEISEGFQEVSESSTFKNHELFQRQISNRSIGDNSTLSANDTDVSAKDEEMPSIGNSIFTDSVYLNRMRYSCRKYATNFIIEIHTLQKNYKHLQMVRFTPTSLEQYYLLDPFTEFLVY